MVLLALDNELLSATLTLATRPNHDFGRVNQAYELHNAPVCRCEVTLWTHSTFLKKVVSATTASSFRP